MKDMLHKFDKKHDQTCNDKRKFNSLTEAKSCYKGFVKSRILHRLGERKEPVTPYKCDHCHYWHLGHVLDNDHRYRAQVQRKTRNLRRRQRRFDLRRFQESQEEHQT